MSDITGKKETDIWMHAENEDNAALLIIVCRTDAWKQLFLQ